MKRTPMKRTAWPRRAPVVVLESKQDFHSVKRSSVAMQNEVLTRRVAPEYTYPVSKEIQDWRPVAPAARAALESAAFCFVAPFLAAHSGSLKTRRFRSAGARYANLIGLLPRLASWEAVNTTAPTEASMADIFSGVPAKITPFSFNSRVAGRFQAHAQKAVTA